MSADHHVYRVTIALLGGLLALGVVRPARAQLGLGLAPMRVELKMAPGQQYSGSLKLSSQSGAKTRIRAEVDDFDIDDKAAPQFERDIPQEAAYSCKKWLTLNPMEIELDKDGFLNVRYTLRLPAEVADGSYNCAAGFVTLPAAEEAKAGIGMRMAVRIVAAIYIQVGSPVVVGGLKDIRLEAVPPSPRRPQPPAPQDQAPPAEAPTVPPSPQPPPPPTSPDQATPASQDQAPLASQNQAQLDSQNQASPAEAPQVTLSQEGGWQAVVVLENDGRMYYRPTGKLEVLNEAGKAVETQDFQSLPVLRQRAQRFIFPLKTKLETGHYKLRASVDIGTGEIQQGTVDAVLDKPAQPVAH